MRVGLFAVGRLKAGPEKDLAARYLDRFAKAGPAIGLEFSRVFEVQESRLPQPEGRKREEAAMLEKALPDGSVLILLDERGKALGSEDFASLIGRYRDDGKRDPDDRDRRRGRARSRPRRPRGLPNLLRQDDLAAPAGAHHGRRTALPRRHHPVRPPLSPGVTDFRHNRPAQACRRVGSLCSAADKRAGSDTGLMTARRATRGAAKARRAASPLVLLPVLALVLVMAPVDIQTSGAQDAATAPKQDHPPGDAAAGQPPAPADPTADLAARREATRQELEALSKTITLSDERVETLKKGIADLKQNTAGIRDALVVSATRRKELETRIAEGEKSLSKLRTEETIAKASLHDRRGLLAEVLAALQRMGRNPPPALLVTPEDALSSVRSAILLGAVVPGIRHETDKLVADLAKLAETRKKIDDEGLRLRR